MRIRCAAATRTVPVPGQSACDRTPDARILADLADVVVLVAGYARDTPATIAQAASNFDPRKFAGVIFNEGI